MDWKELQDSRHWTWLESHILNEVAGLSGVSSMSIDEATQLGGKMELLTPNRCIDLWDMPPFRERFRRKHDE